MTMEELFQRASEPHSAIELLKEIVMAQPVPANTSFDQAAQIRQAFELAIQTVREHLPKEK